MQPPLLEWAVVIGFYAAIHYVNAYLWEKAQYAPRNHDERLTAVNTWVDLKAIALSYLRLQDLAYYARYRPNFRITQADATDLLGNDLQAVAGAVIAALTPTS